MLNIEFPMFNVEVKYTSRFGGFVIIAIEMVLLVDFFGLPGFGFGPPFFSLPRLLVAFMPRCLFLLAACSFFQFQRLTLYDEAEVNATLTVSTFPAGPDLHPG
jgi:hypothetical protein